MTTVVNSDSGADGGAAMGILAILLAAAIGFGVWFFMAHGGSMPKSETINISAPSAPAPSAPTPAPSAPSSGD